LSRISLLQTYSSRLSLFPGQLDSFITLLLWKNSRDSSKLSHSNNNPEIKKNSVIILIAWVACIKINKIKMTLVALALFICQCLICLNVQFIYLNPILLFPSPLSSSISPYNESEQFFTTYFFRYLFYLCIYVIHHPSLASFSSKFFSIFFSRFYCSANIISINHYIVAPLSLISP